MVCCSSNFKTQSVISISDAEIVQNVTESYGAHALRAGDDQAHAEVVAAAFGYTGEDLKAIPAEANLGLSCGNPTGTANIKEGERVLDLGSGGGIDIFLAASKVGPTGQAIGLDGSSEMIALARRNAAKKGLKPPQVAFVQANLEKELPIEPNAIDCVISNCVVNLLPVAGKQHIFKELVAKKPLPQEIRDDLNAYISCIAGAVTEDEYRSYLVGAGFHDLLFVDKKSDVNVYWESETDGGCCSNGNSNRLHKPDLDVNEWIASYQIYAIKPKRDEEVPIRETALKRWWDAYPVVESSPPTLTNDEVADLVLKTPESSKDFVVIDVRRNDHAGGHVRGSEQWAAQTFYNDLPEFFDKHKDTDKVIFYCQSSNGRGPRCAGWYQDYLDKQGEKGTFSKAYVLQGGIKGWLDKFQDREELVDRD